ncbi:MAG: hypothetical protein P4L40_08280 [Terracidiphilus sp.]|nr:hypothetical protein [Terracidiphilus sp.]
MAVALVVAVPVTLPDTVTLDVSVADDVEDVVPVCEAGGETVADFVAVTVMVDVAVTVPDTVTLGVMVTDAVTDTVPVTDGDGEKLPVWEDVVE